jgi:integrase
MATRVRHKGRRAGTRNKGYFFRKGRGWCASEGNRAIPLLRIDGSPIREPNAPTEEIREAFARHTLATKEKARSFEYGDQITVLELCQLYLDHCQASNSASTYRVRTDALFDFCTGLPASLRDKGNGKKATRAETEENRIHNGFGKKLVSQLLPLDVDRWLACHSSWRGCQRTKIQALKRALNYGVEAGVISKNPLTGYKVAKANIRNTYLTPEQEAACYENANADFALAMRVCIRTGARYGCEFSKLTGKHVTINGDRMEWRFSPQESKTGKLRIIRVSDPEMIGIVREQIRKYPSGPIFRNTVGYPWTAVSLKQAFSSLKARLAKKGIQLDESACMYSCRHTFAKRTLQGYWTGKMTNIETLSILMGNSRQVCWEHYAEWCETYTDPLWEAV